MPIPVGPFEGTYLGVTLVAGQRVLLPVSKLRIVEGPAEIHQGFGDFRLDCLGVRPLQQVAILVLVKQRLAHQSPGLTK